MTATVQHSAAGLSLEQTTAREDYTIGALCTPNAKGDIRTMWDSRNAEEVTAARTQFEELRKKGYLAYAAKGKDGHRGRLIREFDPAVERIIMVAPIAGG